MAESMSSAVPVGFTPYRSTGRAPILGLLAGMVVGAIVATAAAPVYVAGATWVPVVQLSALFTVLFGVAVGGAVAGVMRMTKVRNRWATVGFAAVAAAWGLGVAWFSWVGLVFYREDPTAAPLDLINPFYHLAAILGAYEYGTWSIGSSGTAVSGIFLAIVWLAEAATVVGGAVGVALSMTADRVFCEACNSWCTVDPDLRLVELAELDTLRDALVNRGDVAPLTTAPGTQLGDAWVAVKAGWCPGCGDTNVVALDRATATYDRRGNRTVTRTELVGFRLVPRDAMAKLRAWREGLPKA